MVAIQSTAKHMKDTYREDKRGYVHAPNALVTAKFGDVELTERLDNLKDILKQERLTKAPIRYALVDGVKASIFPVLRPTTMTAAIAIRVMGYSVDPNVGYSFWSQGEASDVARALGRLGVELDELEFEWMMGPNTAPKAQLELALQPKPSRFTEADRKAALADSPF
jgi:hypothetical protein